MGKIRVGNKQNSFLNQMWAKHGRVYGKDRADRVRRQQDMKEVRDQLEDLANSQQDIPDEIQEVVNKKFWDML